MKAVGSIHLNLQFKETPMCPRHITDQHIMCRYHWLIKLYMKNCHFHAWSLSLHFWGLTKWDDKWKGEYRFVPPNKNILPRTLDFKSKTPGQVTRWAEIITGQNNLNYIQSKIKNVSPNCRFCKEDDGTFPHTLNECPWFIELSWEILLSRATALENWTVDNIFKFANHPSI